MSEGEERKKKRQRLSKANLVNAVKSNEATAALAMKGAKPWQKVIVYCCYGVILIGIIVLLVPPYEASKQVATASLVIPSLVIVAFLVLVRYRTLTSEPPSAGTTVTPTSVWQPLPTFKFEKLRTMLEDTRKVAFNFLKSRQPALLDDDVRANIFYPKYDYPDKPKKYTLKIYPGLHRKMERDEELGITFKPKQGATGMVFDSRKACVAKKLSSDTGGWDATFNITEDLAKIIHPDLKWIISMPLQTDGNKPIGVMNVDGLKYDFPNDVLNDCMVRLLTQNVIIMSQIVISS